MGLTGAYSNPEIQGRLRHLAEKLDQLAASDAAPRRSGRSGRTRNGVVPRAIERILAEAPGPMRTCDIHAAVEDLLGMSIPVPTVQCWLSKNIQGDSPKLVRLGHGRYRLLNGA